MATLTFDPREAVDFIGLNTTRTGFEVKSSTAYDFDSANGTDIDIEGTGFTFDASNNLVSGRITRIDIDLSGNQGTSNGGDINIAGLTITALADLRAIDDNAFSLMRIALKGDDEFQLSGFNIDADTGIATNRLFGDTLFHQHPVSSSAINTNVGGNDSFFGGNNRFEIAGDAWDLFSQSGFTSDSLYTGGNDSVFGTLSGQFHRIAGDAWTIDRQGAGQMTLNGGNDFIDLGGNSASESWISGDVNEMFDGIVNGGDDELISDDSGTPEVAGDVRTWFGGTVNGGDDVISLANGGQASGDIFFVKAPTASGSFTLTGGDDEIYGGAGNDTIAGDIYDRLGVSGLILIGGDDLIFGGAGHDQLYGDVAFGDSGEVSFSQLGGNDVIHGGAGSDFLSGQGGDDVLDGGSGADLIRGGFGNDRMLGGSGNDMLEGGVDNDRLEGGAGDDSLDGGGQNDVLIGGDGFDLAVYNNNVAAVTVSLAIAGAQNTGGAGIDTLIGIEGIVGSIVNDVLTGNNAANYLRGDQGDDILFGGGGADQLDGFFNDDRLHGGLGKDVLTGGDGKDRFVFDAALGATNVDSITDFSVADDTILLDDAIFGLPVGALGLGVFRLGAAALDANDRIIYNPNNGALIFDANGNAAGGAVLVATLSPGLAMTPADFLVF